MSDKGNILSYFSHPIFQYKLENHKEHNRDLAKYIYQLYDEDKDGVQKTNISGWHSKSFIFSDKKNAPSIFFNAIQGFVVDVFKNYGWLYDTNKVVCSSMWSIINKKNSFNIEHTHPNNYLSAAYYVKAPDNCGRFSITNPHMISRDKIPKRTDRTEFNRNAAQIEVKEGDLLIFPSYLPHSVEQNKSDEDRIVISFNIDIIK